MNDQNSESYVKEEGGMEWENEEWESEDEEEAGQSVEAEGNGDEASSAEDILRMRFALFSLKGQGRSRIPL
jgi:hypothetical protein